MSRRSKSPRFPVTVAEQRVSRHAADRSRHPRLSDDDLADDSTLPGTIDALLTADDNYSKHAQKILSAQDRLQQLCCTDAWLAFLDVEQLTTARVNFMLATVARWAFNEGRRSRG